MLKKSDVSPVRLVVVLLVIAAVTALALGLVNHITTGRISELKAEKTADAMKEVMPGDYSFEPLEYDIADASVRAIYCAVGPGGISGYVVEATPSGFGGEIDMVVGLTPEGIVTGVSIISSKETSGLGSNAAKPEFRDQFTGGTAPFSVNKDGGEITAITGATITSRAVTKGVNTAIAELRYLLSNFDVVLDGEELP